MIHRPKWQGSVLVKRGWLILQLKDDRGRWRQRGTGLKDTPEGRREAERRLASLRREIHAIEDATRGADAPLTVDRWAETWRAQRTNLDAKSDELRLRLHVLPAIGSILLADVEPRHLAALARDWTAAGLAPRTRRNVYSVVKAMFRDARIDGALRGPDPCILTHRQLGRPRDKVQGWRATAVFERDELVRLISDLRIPEDRQLMWALCSLAFLRHGEMAGLCWRHVQPWKPLSRLVVQTSYDRGRTKTDTERWCPVHPTLAAMLARWKLGGWRKLHHRPPEPDDLVVPSYRLRMRHKSNTLRFLHQDCVTLGIRERRVQDLRRTGISLARSDGADPFLLRRATHAAPRAVLDLYTTPEWEALCREVGRLQLVRRRADGSGR